LNTSADKKFSLDFSAQCSFCSCNTKPQQPVVTCPRPAASTH